MVRDKLGTTQEKLANNTYSFSALVQILGRSGEENQTILWEWSKLHPSENVFTAEKARQLCDFFLYF